MPDLTLNDHVRYYDHEHGGILMLDMAAGRWMALNATASDLWRSWRSNCHFEESVTRVAAKYPEVPYMTIRADAESLLREMTSRGLMNALPALSTLPGKSRPGVTMAEIEQATQRWHRLQAVRIFMAFICVLAACLLLRYSFHAAVRLVRASRRSWCRRSTDAGVARRTVAYVATAARYYPGRAACLELSLAAVILAAIRRRRLDWCLGSAIDPYQFHAWVEVNGTEIPAAGRPLEDSQYLRILAV